MFDIMIIFAMMSLFLVSLGLIEVAFALLDTIADRVDANLPIYDRRFYGQVTRFVRAYFYLCISLCVWLALVLIGLYIHFTPESESCNKCG